MNPLSTICEKPPKRGRKASINKQILLPLPVFLSSQTQFQKSRLASAASPKSGQLRQSSRRGILKNSWTQGEMVQVVHTVSELPTISLMREQRRARADTRRQSTERNFKRLERCYSTGEMKPQQRM